VCDNGEKIREAHKP